MYFSEIGVIWNNICDFDALQTADSDKWVYQIPEMLSGSIVCVYTMWMSHHRLLKDLEMQRDVVLRLAEFLKTIILRNISSYVAALPSREKLVSEAQRVQSMINVITFRIQLNNISIIITLISSLHWQH